jgi:fructose-1,6-bisphosphatase II / sedoheptulose-1,7-bisphosphatase
MIIDELKDLNVKTKLISDGDVLGVLYVSDPKYNVDMYMGIGGGPEGVLAAAALDSYECHFQGRFIFDNDKDIKEANTMGITDLDKKYELRELIKGDTIFCATGITTSDFINGIIFDQEKVSTETLVTHKSSNFKKLIQSTNKINE